MSVGIMNKAYWWQRLIPRYGNWGGPGWSAGRWNPSVTNWAVDAVDSMDELFKWHDWAYQNGFDRTVADYTLTHDLRRVRVAGVYANLYRLGAIVLFIIWPAFRSLLKG